MDVLQETVRYIEELERRLLDRVRLTGLPHHLHKLDQAAAAGHRPATVSAGSLENPVGPTRTGPVGGSGGGGLEIQDLRNLLHHSLQPALEQKLKKQKNEDDAVIRRLIAESGVGSSAVSSQQ
jgi:hypothetical protein